MIATLSCGLGFNLELELVGVVPATSRCGERDFVRPWVRSASSVRTLFSTNPSTTTAVFFLSSTAIGACVEVVVVVFFYPWPIPPWPGFL